MFRLGSLTANSRTGVTFTIQFYVPSNSQREPVIDGHTIWHACIHIQRLKKAQTDDADHYLYKVKQQFVRAFHYHLLVT